MQQQYRLLLSTLSSMLAIVMLPRFVWYNEFAKVKYMVPYLAVQVMKPQIYMGNADLLVPLCGVPKMSKG